MMFRGEWGQGRTPAFAEFKLLLRDLVCGMFCIVVYTSKSKKHPDLTCHTCHLFPVGLTCVHWLTPNYLCRRQLQIGEQKLQQLHHNRDRAQLQMGQLPLCTNNPVPNIDAAIAAEKAVREGLLQAASTLEQDLQLYADEQQALQARLEAQQQAVSAAAMQKVANVLEGVSEGVSSLLAELDAALVPGKPLGKAATEGKRGAATSSSCLAAVTQQQMAVASRLSQGREGPTNLRAVHQALKQLQVSVLLHTPGIGADRFGHFKLYVCTHTSSGVHKNQSRVLTANHHCHFVQPGPGKPLALA
jgi:hypothetical protein